jgi:hypothetical protein
MIVEQQLLADLLMLVIFASGGTWPYLPSRQTTAARLGSRVCLPPRPISCKGADVRILNPDK